jgi:hypothetical protein
VVARCVYAFKKGVSIQRCKVRAETNVAAEKAALEGILNISKLMSAKSCAIRILIGQPTSKPDRMICRFVARAAGLEDVAPPVAKRAVIDATELLKAKYPNLTTRLLDHVIWNYESQRANGKVKKSSIAKETCN